ncbi:hypothetical protein GCM10020331_037810 [Ectobacillus funiculus]
MKPIVTGVLGYGFFRENFFHCPFIDAHEHFELKKTVVQRHGNTAKDDYPYIHVAKRLPRAF